MRAALYARFSSENQRYESISGQLRCSEEYCLRKGYTIAARYTDEARSGTTIVGRDGFNKMIDDSEKGIFDVVIFYQIDRTARNESDYFRSMERLIKNNVTYEYSAEGIDITTMNGKLQETIKVGFAAYFSRDLAIKIKRGKKETFLEKKFNGGWAPFGYDIDQDQNYIINEKEAAAVRQIFQMKLDGYGYGEIEKWLYSHDFKTKRGTFFSKNSVHDILRNKKYIGILEMGKTSKNSSRVHSQNYNQIEDALPAIIDTETFAEVQKIMDSHKKGRSEAIAPYHLTGRVFCTCGAPMVGHRTGHKGQKYLYYACVDKRYKKLPCKERSIPKEALEIYVAKTVVQFLQQDYENIVNSFISATQKPELEAARKQLKETVDKLEVKAARILQLWDGVDDTMLNEYKRIRKQVDIARLDLANHTDTEITKEEIQDYLDKIIAQSRSSELNLDKFFRSFDVKVFVQEEDLKIEVNFRISHCVVALTRIELVISP